MLSKIKYALETIYEPHSISNTPHDLAFYANQSNIYSKGNSIV